MDFKTVEKIRERTLLGVDELDSLVDLVKETQFIQGSMAEVGVFRGGSSYAIGYTDHRRMLYSFDSFQGIPAGLSGVDLLPKGLFKSEENEVREFLAELPNISVHRGWFPHNFPWLKKSKFSFVHIDVDLYQPTLDCLEFFYPRLSSGGILISDDYQWQDCPGVKKAFDEFMIDKPEKLVATDFYTCYFKKE